MGKLSCFSDYGLAFPLHFLCLGYFLSSSPAFCPRKIFAFISSLTQPLLVNDWVLKTYCFFVFTANPNPSTPLKADKHFEPSSSVHAEDWTHTSKFRDFLKALMWEACMPRMVYIICWTEQSSCVVWFGSPQILTAVWCCLVPLLLLFFMYKNNFFLSACQTVSHSQSKSIISKSYKYYILPRNKKIRMTGKSLIVLGWSRWG